MSKVRSPKKQTKDVHINVQISRSPVPCTPTCPALMPCPDLSGVSWPMPFESQINLFSLAYPEIPLARRFAEMQAEIKDLANELTETFREIARLTEKPHYAASAKAILVVASINNGQFVRDVFEVLQSVIFDLQARSYDGEKYKGAVKATIKVEPDKGETTAVLTVSEVKQDTPASLGAGKCFINTNGEIVLPDDAVKQLPLMGVQ